MYTAAGTTIGMLFQSTHPVRGATIGGRVMEGVI